VPRGRMRSRDWDRARPRSEAGRPPSGSPVRARPARPRLPAGGAGPRLPLVAVPSGRLAHLSLEPTTGGARLTWEHSLRESAPRPEEAAGPGAPAPTDAAGSPCPLLEVAPDGRPRPDRSVVSAALLRLVDRLPAARPHLRHVACYPPRRRPDARSPYLRPFRLTTLALLLGGAPNALAKPPGPPPVVAAKAAAAIVLSRATVPATGRQTADVTVDRFGRYALSAASSQGTAVQLVDPHERPRRRERHAGQDQRPRDAFLEAGVYRVVALSDHAGTGDARLEAHPFVEKNGPKPPLLPDLTHVTSTLADLEQRSWWVEVPMTDRFPSSSRDAASATCGSGAKASGSIPPRPLRHRQRRPHAPAPRVSHRRAPLRGALQLVAYGGPALRGPRPTARSRSTCAAASPAPRSGPHHRHHRPLRGRTLRRPGQGHRVSPRAAVRHRRPPQRARLGRRRAVRRGRVLREHPEGVGATRGRGLPASQGPERVVTVGGAAGQPFVLQFFPNAGRSITLAGSGTYFLTTLHPGDPADRVDATGIITEVVKGKDTPPVPPIAASLVPLGSTQPYRRSFNVFGTTTISSTCSRMATTRWPRRTAPRSGASNRCC